MAQKSEDWFKMRYRKVGGSTIDKLTTPAKFKTLKNELISARLEPFVFIEDDKIHSKHMDRGNDLEPLARYYVSGYTGLEFKEFGWLQSNNKIFGLSPDGMTEDEKNSLEIKCPSRAVHTKYILAGNKIPSEYFWQNIAYFAVNPKLEKHFFVSYRPECAIEAHIINLERDTMTEFGCYTKNTINEYGHFYKNDPMFKTVQKWADLLLSYVENMDKDCLLYTSPSPRD